MGIAREQRTARVVRITEDLLPDVPFRQLLGRKISLGEIARVDGNGSPGDADDAGEKDQVLAARGRAPHASLTGEVRAEWVLDGSSLAVGDQVVFESVDVR